MLTRTTLALLLPLSAFAANPGYFRHPSVHRETVVFTAEGDLWLAPLAGGEAKRLTSHPGTETHAAFSPDGALISFSAQYEGPTETYVIPVQGGLPTRLTWNGEGSIPAGWTPDGKVLVTTRSQSTLPNDQLLRIDPATFESTPVPLAQASEGAYHPANGTLVFTRLPFQGSSTKRYVGGTAQNLWSFPKDAQEAAPLTGDFPGTSKNPMWHQDRICFLTDRSGTMNLWLMNADGSNPEPLTRHEPFEVRNADIFQNHVVYQLAGSIRHYNLADRSDREIPITLPSDFDHTRTRWVHDPFDYLTRFSLSPSGSHLALTARGCIFIARVKSGGRLVEIPRSPRTRYREAVFLGDDATLVAQSDASGEIEFIQAPAHGLASPTDLTSDARIFRFSPVPSPDGRFLAWHDKNLELWVRDLGKKTSRLVTTAPSRGLGNLAWSPDSQWLAFVEPAPNSFRKIRLYRPSDHTLIDATGDRTLSDSPAWSTDGRWLYFLSDRTLRSLVNSPWGMRQPEPFFTESTRIYALSLRKDGRFPFLPPDDTPDLDAPAPAKEKGKDTAKPGAAPERGKEKDRDQDKESGKSDPPKPAAPPEVVIDAEGLASRLYQVPGVVGNLSSLHATPKHLLFLSHPVGHDGKPRLMRLPIGNDKPETQLLLQEPGSFDLSADGRHLALRKGKSFFVVPADGPAPAKLENPVDLSSWKFSVDPREEWHQIYQEAWRMLRDYFYDPAMHGLDWNAIRDRYAPLVDRVADRSDLSDILHEMSGELSALHLYVGHGDLRNGPDSIAPASLGARLSRDPATQGWRIDSIYRTDPDYPSELSPLARPESRAEPGEILIAINGQPLDGVPHPDALLANKAHQPVLLTLLSADGGKTRRLTVRPLHPDQARDLRYSDWEYSRRLLTESLGQGRIGYVHLRNMGPESILEWAREFYPVYQKQGLILDVRHNRGGNTDSWILSRLMRKAWFHWSPRAGQPYPNMQYAFRGHVVVLCNEWTSSDGEALSEGFRRLGLGKVIGTRTWGGQIWLNSSRWLVDNGMCTAAEIGVYGPEGEWLIEGSGLTPDEIVDNLPHASFNGEDAQLQAAIRHLEERIAADPRPVPEPPARPDKSKR